MPFQRQTADDLDTSLLDALLNRQPLPADAPPQAWAVAEMLASLVRPAGSGELAGAAAARSAFRRSSPKATRSPAIQRSSRRPSWLPARISARLTAGLVAGAIGMGVAAAGYARVLPAPMQQLAHYLFHAPSPRSATSHKQKHLAGHKADGRSEHARRGPAPGNGGAYHHAKAHHAKVRHHPRGNHRLKAHRDTSANHHLKAPPRHREPPPQGESRRAITPKRGRLASDQREYR